MKSISIKNYKNLRDLKIDSLSKVNLIVGTNNSGKSTLLEAISIFAANGDINQTKRILEMRGIITSFALSEDEVVNKEVNNFTSIFADMNIELCNTIEISVNNDEKLLLKIVNVELEWVTNSVGDDILQRRVIEDGEDISHKSNISKGIAVYVNNEPNPIQLYVIRGSRARYAPLEKKITYEYIQSAHISNARNSLYYAAISMSTLEKELIASLNIIEPRIDAINFLEDYKKSSSSNELVPQVVYKGSSNRYRLSTMGDGINRILTIVLAMLNCKDGVLLVDEFDNGLHYSVQTKLWKMVYRLAESLNVQVFATTHSDDCIKSFIEADEKGDGNLIRLENRSGDIVAVSYDDKDELNYISTGNIEVR